MIGDDGLGFTLTESTALKGFGLISMQQRVDRIGGHLTIRSGGQRPNLEGDRNQGTQVCVVWELTQERHHGH